MTKDSCSKNRLCTWQQVSHCSFVCVSREMSLVRWILSGFSKWRLWWRACVFPKVNHQVAAVSPTQPQRLSVGSRQLTWRVQPRFFTSVWNWWCSLVYCIGYSLIYLLKTPTSPCGAHTLCPAAATKLLSGNKAISNSQTNQKIKHPFNNISK